MIFVGAFIISEQVLLEKEQVKFSVQARACLGVLASKVVVVALRLPHVDADVNVRLDSVPKEARSAEARARAKALRPRSSRAVGMFERLGLRGMNPIPVQHFDH